MSKRKLLDTFGRRGDRDVVRVFREPVAGVPMIRVQWNEAGRKTRSFDDTRAGLAEAKGYARGVHDRLGNPTPAMSFAPVTVRELWDRYVAAKSIDWRATTLEGKVNRWSLFELHVGRSKPAGAITREHLDELKRTLLSTNPKGGTRLRSVNQVKMTIETVTTAFRWAVDHDLIPPTKVVTYRPQFGKDVKRQRVETAEYSAEERAKLLEVLDPRDARSWRPWALTTVFAYAGPRQSATRHLEWGDIDFDTERIRWRPENDKMGNDRSQPMPAPVKEALYVAYGWAIANGYTGRWVFFRPGAGTRDLSNGGYRSKRQLERAARIPDEPITYSAYNTALRNAETRAGLEHVAYKSSHAFRRGIAGDVHAATGSMRAAADWIGDRSVKVVDRHYVKTRDEELKKTATLVGGSSPKEGT